MLSIREELKKLTPVDLASRGNGAVDAPADLLTQWQQIAAGISDIAAGQRRAVEQLESFLESVRSAAADTQRNAASSREFLEQHRAVIQKDRADQERMLEKFRETLSASLAAELKAHAQQTKADVAAVNSDVVKLMSSLRADAATASTQREKVLTEHLAATRDDLIEHLKTARHELEAVIEPLASSALDFREIAVGLESHLAKVEGLNANIQMNAQAIRSAVKEELVHRHEEMQRLQAATEESAKRTSDQIANAVAALDESVLKQSQALLKEFEREHERSVAHRDQVVSAVRTEVTAERERVAGDVDKRMSEATTLIRELNEKLAETRAAEAALSAANEAKMRADVERIEDQMAAASRSMMAFLEALDDVAEVSGGAGALGRLTSRAKRVLEAAGLTEIEAEGTAVNEELHEVVQRVPSSESVPAGRIVRVVQRGFRDADRVVRRAQVVVAE